LEENTAEEYNSFRPLSLILFQVAADNFCLMKLFLVFKMVFLCISTTSFIRLSILQNGFSEVDIGTKFIFSVLFLLITTFGRFIFLMRLQASPSKIFWRTKCLFVLKIQGEVCIFKKLKIDVSPFIYRVINIIRE